MAGHYATLRFKIDGGNDLLPRGIAARLGERIQLGCEVVAIDHTAHRVAVAFRHGQAQHVVHATNVVVAVPVPALRQITFESPLPPGTSAGLAAVSYAPWAFGRPVRLSNHWLTTAGPAGRLDFLLQNSRNRCRSVWIERAST